MDNISVTAALIFVIPTIATTGGFSETAIIWSTILGANLGASLTPIGSVASIVGIGLLKREGKGILWLDFMKFGALITIKNLTLATGYIFLLSVLLGW
jgi:Na+/H+ antiporter NhaD/arsenite permease-like protein